MASRSWRRRRRPPCGGCAAPNHPRLVLATHNLGKAAEFHRLLDGWPVEVAGLDGADAVEEVASGYLGNARLKSQHAAALTGLAALGDDSGLEVEALPGELGSRSARWGGEGLTPRDRLELLLRRLHDLDLGPGPWPAAMVCCLVLTVPEAAPPFLGLPPGEMVARSRCRGLIQAQPRGAGGFGYDPLFAPLGGGGRTFAEMPLGLKDRLSHRGRAVRSLRRRLSL